MDIAALERPHGPGRVWSDSHGERVGAARIAVRVFHLAGGCPVAWTAQSAHLLFNGLWPAYYLLYTHRREAWRSLFGWALVGLVPVVGAIGLLGLYNRLRFASVLATGVEYHQMNPYFVDDFARYGVFNLHYVPKNLFYQYLAYPLPIRPASREGGSLFLLSPVFFAAWWGIWRGRQRWSTSALVGSIGLVAVPILFRTLSCGRPVVLSALAGHATAVGFIKGCWFSL
ncbi:MAG: hypothetical protein H0X37_25880 [Herpetosiphonaceae bacterium]|nr:hypothetical protein [Herpetosiphonaceae bacterium]